MKDDCLHSLEITLTGSLSDFSVLKSKPFRRINSLLSDSHIFDNASLFFDLHSFEIFWCKKSFYFRRTFSNLPVTYVFLTYSWRKSILSSCCLAQPKLCLSGVIVLSSS